MLQVTTSRVGPGDSLDGTGDSDGPGELLGDGPGELTGELLCGELGDDGDDELELCGQHSTSFSYWNQYSIRGWEATPW